MIDIFSVYIPQDRRASLGTGTMLPERAEGAALFSDISGFTTLTDALVTALGVQRGAEELSRQLDIIYDPLIVEVERHGGSVISFSGDAITCWFDAQHCGSRTQATLSATACALAMQTIVARFAQIPISDGQMVRLAIKVAVASGKVRRFLVGIPTIQVIDVLAGAILDRLAEAEHEAGKGEVVLDTQASIDVGAEAQIVELRATPNGNRVTVVRGVQHAPQLTAWPAPSAPIHEAEGQPWLLAPVYERLQGGLSTFLTELRPAVALFMRFEGIDYDEDSDAGIRTNAFISWVQQVCERYGGSVLQVTIGDKGSYLYATFGAPRSYGDDSVRTVRAALELRQPPSELAFVNSIQIGISQGRMRTGSYGGTTRRTYGVLGDEVNMAARLMQSALPGQILVTLATRKTVGDVFTWQSLPPLRVKGKTRPAIVYAVVDSRTSPAIRLQEPRYALPMVGRQAELLQIEQLLQQAATGRGQIVGITGEAGMGKSRLVAESIRLATQAHFVGYGGECQPYGIRTAYLVWQPILQAFFGLDPAAAPEAQVQTLRSVVADLCPTRLGLLALLGAALGLPIPENSATETLPAPARKALLAQLLVELFRARATTPLLLVIEDAQWIDSLSADLLDTVGRAIGELRVLIIVVYRPVDPGEQRALRVHGLAHFTELRLSEFTAEQSAHLIRLKLDELFEGTTIPDNVIAHIQHRAQGNPFYIEELLNYIQDRDIDPRQTTQLAELELPTSLASLILSRIDTLSESQQATLRVASVVGRRFIVAWLWGVYPEIGISEKVMADLERLDRMGLTPQDTPEPELAYLFKHILTQEVAYESLPYATRAWLHEELAHWLETTVGRLGMLPVDLLAFHYSRSENRAKELEYTSAAGELASRNGAYIEAYSYLGRAIDLLSHQPATPHAVETELSLQLNLGAVCIASFGQGSDEAKRCYDRARELCGMLPQTPQLARALFGLSSFYLFRGEMKPAYDLALQCFALAQHEPHGSLLLPGHMVMANTLFWMGEFGPGLSHLEQVVAHYDPDQHHNYIVRFAQNPRITAMTCGMLGLWITGRIDEALARGMESLELAQNLNHDFSIVLALHSIAVLHQNRGETEHTRRCAERFAQLAAQRGIQFYATLGAILLGWVAFEEGHAAEGIAQMRQGLANMTALGSTLLHSYYVTVLAAACLRMGELEAGLQMIEASLADALANNRRSFLAELYRLKGELLNAGATADAAVAEYWFSQALETARSQSARSFELRAAMSIGRLWRSQGRLTETRDLLGTLYTTFTEGFETRDLRAAARLLEDLQPSSSESNKLVGHDHH